MAIGNSCKTCGKKIETNQYGTVCSSKCKTAALKDNPDNVKKNCQKCGADFFCTKRREHTTRFCSWECRKSKTIKKCEECGREFAVTSLNHIKRRFCSVKCARGGEKSHFFGLKGELSYVYGQTPWTKGKSAKTDEKIAALGKKVSAKLKQKFKDGEMSNAGERNPMFGKVWSKERKDRASLMIAEKISSGNWNTKHPRYICGYYQSNKMNKSFWYRSSLELRMMKCLDRDEQIKEYNYEPFSIKYNEIKRYIPDFLCEHTDGTKALIECKPTFQLEIEAVQLKSAAGRKMCEENGWEYKIYTLNDIKEYETKLGLVNIV